MNERGTELMRKASRQLDEIAEFFGTLNDADLRKPCPGDSGGDTVGAVAAHMAQGYHFLGKFLQAGGYVPGSAATGNRKGRGHRYRQGHGRTFAPAALPDVVDRLTDGKAPIGLLADLTDEQLDRVPPAGSSRFSDGSRTLEQVIDEVIAHQAAHLMTLKGAVITRDRKDTRMAGSPPYPHPHHRSTAPRGPEDLYTSPPPWDIGRPQPAFLALAYAGAIRGRVLDVGCGTGEHVLMCAGLGLDATGVDLASAALHAAKEKARDRGRTARFLLQDALYLADLGESFDTVLDCGLFHIFNDEDRAAFVDSLRYVLTPGGRYFMLCFSDQQPGDWGPHRVTRDEITASFTDGWRIDSIEPSTIDITTDPDGIRAWLVTLTRIPTSANPSNIRAALISAHEGAHPSGEDRIRNAMLTAEAQVETERPGRYLVQLCRHASQMGQHLRQRPRTHDGGDAPPEVQHVEWSDTYGIVRLSWGQWTMQTTPDTLTLRAEANDEENLRRIQDLVASRLEIFGRRDHLKVKWQRFKAPTAQRGEGEHGRGSTWWRRSRWVVVFGVILVKLGIITLLLVLPFGLAISLGASHGVAVLVLLVVAAVMPLVNKLRGRTLPPARSHQPPRGHRFVLGWWSAKVARIFSHKGRK